jgi:hypothetical protein
MKIVKKIDVKSLGKLIGFGYVLLGLIFGLIFFLFTIISQGNENSVPIWIGGLSIIGIPLAYGFMGYVMGLLVAVVYNFSAKHIGGIQFEVEDVKPTLQ